MKNIFSYGTVEKMYFSLFYSYNFYYYEIFHTLLLLMRWVRFGLLIDSGMNNKPHAAHENMTSNDMYWMNHSIKQLRYFSGKSIHGHKYERDKYNVDTCSSIELEREREKAE